MRVCAVRVCVCVLCDCVCEMQVQVCVCVCDEPLGARGRLGVVCVREGPLVVS